MKNLENILKDRAIKRFDLLFDKTLKLLRENEILSKLEIFQKEKNRLCLVSSFGVCYGTDLFHGDIGALQLLHDNTNFTQIKDELLKKFEEEETEEFLSKIETLREYLNREKREEECK